MPYRRETVTELRRRPIRVWASLSLGLVLAWAGLARAETPTQMTQQLIESIIACSETNGTQPNGCDVEKIEAHLALAQLARWLMGPYWQDLGQENSAISPPSWRACCAISPIREPPSSYPATRSCTVRTMLRVRKPLLKPRSSTPKKARS